MTVAAKIALVANHPNRGGNRANNAGANPTPNQVRELIEKSGMTQPAFGALVYKSTRIVEDWLSGDRRMPPDTWEILNVKVKALELVKRGRLAPHALRELGLNLPEA